ncbi:MAG: glutamate-5-semialdehyde dehydrogenase [Candidatus Marinimicrobia bacterium]|nr:glutamate-5-semialdehyde dehydrogenase [Candidatus Neomarinimicrobiota bacterium]
MIRELGLKTKQASKILPTLTTDRKHEILAEMRARLLASVDEILLANTLDIKNATKKGLSSAMIDRLKLNEARIQSMADSISEVAELDDVVGQIVEEYERPNGLLVQRKRIPLGVIGVIYESRPNVTIEAASLCFYAGNGLLLRGGSEAFYSNRILVRLLKDALATFDLEDVINMVDNTDRSSVDEMAKLNDALDVIIPRGGEGLIRRIYEIATVPVIAHYKGNCHTFVDATADLSQAIDVCLNAKVQRPGVCNAMETLLVHEDIADKFLPGLLERMAIEDVEIRGCSKTQKYSKNIIPATEKDYDTEFLDLILSVRVVEDVSAAIQHIQTYTSDHTEAILSQNEENIARFTRALDSSAIMVNTSTRFNDGGQLGLGAEIGISTTKLHSFGPMGLRELTSVKFVVRGNGQVRN